MANPVAGRDVAMIQSIIKMDGVVIVKDTVVGQMGTKTPVANLFLPPSKISFRQIISITAWLIQLPILQRLLTQGQN